MDELTKLMNERDQHLKFAVEANDILRDMWNSGELTAERKKHVAKLLEVDISEEAI